MNIIRERHPTLKKRIRRDFRPAIILSSIIIFVLILNLPTPDGLTTEGQKCIAIFCVAILLWVSHALPLMITSLLVIILFPLTGVMSTHDAYALFGNEAIFFILGAFILASGIMRSGLSSRIALVVLRFCGNTPNNLVLSFLFLGGFLSFWMSEHAVAAMMFPIVLEVVDALKLQPLRSNFGKILFLSMTWGCVIGGVATFLGGARAPLAVGLLRQITNSDISFLQWMIATLPTVIIMLCVAYFFLTRRYPSEVKDISQAHVVLKRKQLRIGRISKREKYIGALMILTVLVWIFGGDVLGLANIAIGSVVIAFALKLLDWKEVEEDVNWGIFLMYGGAISLGYAMEMTGAAHWLAKGTLGGLAGSGWMVVIALVIMSFFLTEAISNTAVVALLMPLALGIALDYNLDPRVITLAVTVPCGLAFQLPMGTPATAIAFSSGFVQLSDTVISGFVLKLIALIVFLFSAYFYWPLIGLNL